jgi:hypothetical protein
MPDQPLHLLLDQNIPQEVAVWLREKLPAWRTSRKIPSRPALVVALRRW